MDADDQIFDRSPGADIIDRQNGFIRMEYVIDQNGYSGSINYPPRKVVGWAFETPGWPQFHACVRFDRDQPWLEDKWIVDHFETGLYVGEVKLTCKEAAPKALAKRLNKIGRRKVLRTLRRKGYPW